MEPWKFTNVTNGIDHRRWLSEINPGLDALVRDLTGGDDYLLHPQALKKLDAYAEDASVLQRLDEIKRQNKVDFAAYARKAQGVTLDPNAIFDVQVKRLHEYKRQLLNVLHIITLYQQLQDDPNAVTRPHTFLFGAKAAPGYAVAKRIIHLINSLADDISHDPRCRGKLQVVFLENYRVSLAGAPDARQRGLPADLHRRQGGQRHRQHEVHDERRSDRRHAGRRQRGDARCAGGREYVPLRPPCRSGRRSCGGRAMCPSGTSATTRSWSAVWTRCGRASGTASAMRISTSGSSVSDEYLLLADYRAYCDAERRMAETYENRERLEPHEPPQHRPQRHLRRRPGRGGVCRQHLARPPSVTHLHFLPRKTGTAGKNSLQFPKTRGMMTYV